jgi:hypothetical protein
MKLLNIYGVGIGALLLGLISTPAMAITIDLFQDVNNPVGNINGTQSVTDLLNDGNPVSLTDSNLDPTGVIGGQRTIAVNNRNSTSTTTLTVNSINQMANFSSSNGVRSDLSITWNGSSFGSNGIDLTDGGTQKFFLLNGSNDLRVDLVFDVTDINGNTSTLSQRIAPSLSDEDGNLISTNKFFGFANFTGNGDFTKASSIKLSSTNTLAGLDMDFAFIETAVPFEFSPSTGLLFVGGLFGISKLKKKLKSC